MANSKEVLERIAALRMRLDRIQTASADEPTQRRPHRMDVADEPVPCLTARAAKLLEQAREVHAELKTLADEAIFKEELNPFAPLQREAANMLDLIVRSLLSLPPSQAAQLRFCEGLQACLDSAQDKVRILRTGMSARREASDRVDHLADLLRGLITDRPLDLGGFLRVAHAVVIDVEQELPLRFPTGRPGDAASFAAAHGLAVAQVFATVSRPEVPNRQRLAEMIVPALVHDVGMLYVSPVILFKDGPLDAVDRSAIHQHPARGATAARRLWPGGGWPLEAINDHHERQDGSGYPNGCRADDLSEPVRLLAACDVYAALVSPRSHRPAADPRTALSDTLVLADQGILDDRQTEKLARLTFYPAGCVVQLTDGTVALVVGTAKKRSSLAKATVIPLRGPHGELPTHPWPLDLADAPQLGILRALSQGERSQILGRTHPVLV